MELDVAKGVLELGLAHPSNPFDALADELVV